MILKAAPDVDLYCEWSSNVDGPVRIGTRAECLEALTAHVDLDDPEGYHRNCPAVSRREAEAMLTRADETGTSVQHYIGPKKAGAWDSDLTYQQHGTLPRRHLRVFLEALTAHEPWWTDGETPPHVLALVTPWDTKE